MAAGTQPRANPPRASKDVELVAKIMEKTRAKKIVWNKSETGVSASVSGELEIGFVRARSLLHTAGWSLFTVRDKREKAILRVDNLNLPTLGNAAKRAFLEPGREELQECVDELYNVAETSAAAEIEKAIQLIDRV